MDCFCPQKKKKLLMVVLPNIFCLIFWIFRPVIFNFMILFLALGWTQPFLDQQNKKAMRVAVYLRQWLNPFQRGGKMEK